MDPLKGVMSDATQDLAEAGRTLLAQGELDLADLLQRVLASGSEYRVVLTLGIEKKIPTLSSPVFADPKIGG